MNYLQKREGLNRGIRTVRFFGKNASLELLAKRRPQIEQYVRKIGGQIPASTLQELIVQAMLIHENLIAGKQAAGVPDYEVAENSVLSDYAAHDFETDSYTGETTQKTPVISGDLIGSILGVGASLVKGINANRAAKGKPPLLASKKKKAEFYADLEAREKAAAEDAQTAQAQAEEQERLKAIARENGLGTVVNGILNPIRDAEKQREIDKALPVVIPIAIGLLILTFVIGKKF